MALDFCETPIYLNLFHAIVASAAVSLRLLQNESNISKIFTRNLLNGVKYISCSLWNLNSAIVFSIRI